MSALRAPTGAHPGRRARGFTMLEVLIAASILLIGLTAITVALPTTFGVARHGRQLAEADRVAAGMLDGLVTAHTLDGGIPRTGERRVNAEGRVDSAGAYLSSWRVVKDRPVPGAAEIRVVVTWREDAVPRKRELVTFVWQGGRGPGFGGRR